MTIEPWLVFVSVIGAAVLGNVVGIFTLRAQRRKTEAETADILTGAAMQIVDRIEEHVAGLENQVAQQGEKLKAQAAQIAKRDESIADLEKRVHSLESERGALLDGVEQLIKQLSELNQRPVWIPARDTPPARGLSVPLGKVR